MQQSFIHINIILFKEQIKVRTFKFYNTLANKGANDCGWQSTSGCTLQVSLKRSLLKATLPIVVFKY